MSNSDRDRDRSRFHGFDHIRLWVGNAKQAASYYCTRFGFHRVLYRGLENGSRNVVSHVVQKNGIYLVFDSPLNPTSEEDAMGKHLRVHGDGVRDVAFAVSDARTMFDQAVKRGAIPIQSPYEECDVNGKVVLATIRTYGDTVHTFVERKGFRGHFLPGYLAVPQPSDPLDNLLPDTNLLIIDHVVGNQPEQGMEPTCKDYETWFGFHRFWSVDDAQIHTEYSCLRSIVMTDEHETIKIPINEPAQGKRKSQIQEYVDYYGNAGVQHIALRTLDIVKSVAAMRARGCEFLCVPSSYYENLRKKLSVSAIHVEESLEEVEKLNILIDFDEQGYLLQIFTKPIGDRPTLFFEIIQRHNHSGFGVGNFKALFEAIEIEQASRGNLV